MCNPIGSQDISDAPSVAPSYPCSLTFLDTAIKDTSSDNLAITLANLSYCKKKKKKKKKKTSLIS